MKYGKIDYIVNGKKVSIKPKDFTGFQDTKKYAESIKKALKTIGIEEQFIKIDIGGMYSTAFAKAEWEINKQKFRFECNMFDSQYKNLGAITQAIQDDVRHITRGIKSLWASMRQYEALPSPEDIKSNNKYMELDKSELKRLFQVYHPDTAGDNFNQEKFDQIRQALDYKRQQEKDNQTRREE